MELAIALFLALGILYQICRFIDWIIASIFNLFGLGVYPTREFVLRQLGYDPEQYSSDAYINWKHYDEIGKWSKNRYTYKYQS